MGLTIFELKNHYDKKSVFIKMEIVFAYNREDEKEDFIHLLLPYIKDIDLDLYSYTQQTIAKYLKKIEIDTIYCLKIEIINKSKDHFSTSVEPQFSKNVFKKARILQNLSQDELCRKAHIGRTTLSKLENDYKYYRNIRYDKYLRVKSILKSELELLNYYDGRK